MATTTIVSPSPALFDEARLARAGFLARYSGPTRTSYATDLRQFFAWCAQMELQVFTLSRGHVELWADHGGAGPRPGHHRPAAFHPGRLPPHRRPGRAPRALPSSVRPASQDRHRVGHLGPRPHGAVRLRGPGGRWERRRPRPRLSAGGLSWACGSLRPAPSTWRTSPWSGGTGR